MKKAIVSLLALSLCMMMSACSKQEESGIKEVTLVLDYVPNTNHTGIYVAQKQGLFEKNGLKVTIVEPGDNNSSDTMVAVNKAQFGISYQENVTYAAAAEEPLPIKAIAAIIQHNTSGFVSSKDSGITSVNDFEGKVYAGWGAPSEEAVINAMMKKAGADFSKLTMVGADGSGFASLGNGVDINWVYEAWDLPRAKLDGYEYNYIPVRDLDERLDYYTPVIITNDEMIKNDKDTVQKFMDAVSEGYTYAIANPDAAAEMLHEVTPENDLQFLKDSQNFLAKEYSKDSETWGLMKDSVWDNYTSFMFESGLITKEVKASDMFTNEFIK